MVNICLYASVCSIAQLCPNLYDPVDCSPSIKFSRQEYLCEFPFLTPEVVTISSLSASPFTNTLTCIHTCIHPYSFCFILKECDSECNIQQYSLNTQIFLNL